MRAVKEKEVYSACRPEERAVCPSHPGEILKNLYLSELGISISEFSERIGVSRKTVSAIVNKHKSVTPEMALRFAAALNTRPEIWVDLQFNYDLWQTTHAKPGIFEQIKPLFAKAAIL